MARYSVTWWPHASLGSCAVLSLQPLPGLLAIKSGTVCCYPCLHPCSGFCIRLNLSCVTRRALGQDVKFETVATTRSEDNVTHV